MADIIGDGFNNLLNGTVSADSIKGMSGSDTIYGGDGNDILDGDDINNIWAVMGNDSMIGGTGDDTYIVNNSLDAIVEYVGGGIDTVKSSIQYTLGDYLENLTLIDSNNINGYGNSSNNVVKGNSGNNTLYGYAGNDTLDGGGGGNDGSDTLYGGTGDDIYYIYNDTDADTIIEDIYGGYDYIETYKRLAAPTNVEAMILLGTSNYGLTGNNQDNYLMGNSGNNDLTDYAGNDTLDGGSGADTMIGGTGDDIYYVDDVNDVVTEDADAGYDEIITSVNYTLVANVEKLTVTGSGDINITGNANANTLTGNDGANSISGLAGNDTLDGGIDIDSMSGGTGDDVYYVDNVNDIVTENLDEGTDYIGTFITYTLSDNVEGLILLGDSSINGTGNALDNYIDGNLGNNTLNGGLGDDEINGYYGSNILNGDAGNDMLYVYNAEGIYSGNSTLNGGADNDTLYGYNGSHSLLGEAGDDIYYVDDVNDVITENLDEGTDTAYSNIEYTLGSNVENLTLTGTSNIRGYGNSLNNLIIGNSGNNSMYTYGGDDTIYGGAGNDVIASYGGNDMIYGEDGDDTVSGSTENDTIYGGIGNDVLSGGSGNDLLDGGEGIDTLTGGTDNDTYHIDNIGDVVTENLNEGTDAVNSSITYTLGNNVENLTLTGTSNINGYGNSLANLIIGNGTNNTLVGYAGNDTIHGGAGNDSISGSTDIDILYGEDGNDLITGSYGNDTLDGGTGDDKLCGGQDNDYYYTGIGNDTLMDSSEIDYLDLSNQAYTGTTFTAIDASSVTGLYTNDPDTNVDALKITFDESNSVTIYSYFDNTQASIDLTTGLESYTGEFGAWNIETLRFSDKTLSSTTYILDSNEQNLTLIGNSSINGTGNDLNNTIEGNIGNNVLDGGTGSDSMSGETGNDTYYIDNVSDVITENLDEGTDTAYSNIEYTLGSNVENLTLTGTSNIRGYGNSLNNLIIGNSGNNSMYTYGGDDTIYGGAGNDVIASYGGNDMIYGEDGDDTVSGSTENDTIYGGIGNDVLSGGSGNDLLDGGEGIDTLTGGTNNDTLIGGTNDDKYMFYSGDGIDTINDSSGTLDEINFESDVSRTNIALYYDSTTGDLLIDYGSTAGNDKISFVDYNYNTDNSLERIEDGDGYYLGITEINNIIAEISSYNANNDPDLLSAEDVKNNSTLMTYISGQWQS